MDNNYKIPGVHDGSPAPSGSAAESEWKELSDILSGYRGEWTSPDYPGAVLPRIPNTALLGNGNIGVSSCGSETKKSYFISKGDFWEYNNRPLPVGLISVESLTGSSDGAGENGFRETEDILRAEIVTRQTLNGAPLELESWMSAVSDLFVVKVTSHAGAPVRLRFTLEAYVGGGRPVTAEALGGSAVMTRSTVCPDIDDPRTHTKPYISKAAAASRIIGADFVCSADGGASVSMTAGLPAGGCLYLISAVCGGGRTYDKNGKLWAGRKEPVEEALELLDTVSDISGVERLHSSHLDWWKRYWMQSYISMDTSDPDLAVIQKYYYAAQYLLGSGIREGRAAAGLYGIWHTDDNANWHSDFHLNYNFISTYYGLPASNRVSMILPAVEALIEYIPQGIRNAGSLEQLKAVYEPFAEELIARGQIDPEKGIEDAVLFPVAIGPYGMTLEHNSYHHETVNAPFSAYPLIEYWNFTRDEKFMKDTLYVYLKYVLTFMEHWLADEKGRTVLHAGYNEGSWSVNPALELSVYKLCLRYGILISEKLDADSDRRAVWKKLYSGLADQPVIENFLNSGKTVLSLAEKEWRDGLWKELLTPIPSDGNCIPLESVIPGEVYGYYSPSEDLEILRNTVRVFSDNGAWTQINNFPKLPPVAVNVRYDCREIIKGFSNAIRSHMKPNMMIDDGVHGIEKAGATEAVNNMMLLSDKGVIKLFGNWPEDRSARFVRLRASGAFVFTASYDGTAREISPGVSMFSEAGGRAVIASPWKEGVSVYDAGGRAVDIIVGSAPNHPEEITCSFDTEPGMTYTITKKVD